MKSKMITSVFFLLITLALSFAVFGACTIAEIPDKPCNETNAPGLLRVLVIPADDVASIGAASAGVVSTITVSPTKQFFEVFFTENTGIYSPNMDGNLRDAEFYSSTFTVSVPKMRAAVIDPISKMVGTRMIAVLLDGNGKKWIVGDKDRPVRFTLGEGTTGTGEAGQKNAINLTFTLDISNHPDYEFSGDFDALKTIVP